MSLENGTGVTPQVPLIVVALGRLADATSLDVVTNADPEAMLGMTGQEQCRAADRHASWLDSRSWRRVGRLPREPSLGPARGGIVGPVTLVRLDAVCTPDIGSAWDRISFGQ